MRRIFPLILLGALALAGCENNPTPGNTNASSNTNTASVPPAPITPIRPTSPLDPNFVACNPYLPLVPGSTYKYLRNHSSGLTVDVAVVVDAAEENGRKIFVETTQSIDRTGGTEQNQKIIRKFACQDGRIQLLSEFTDTKGGGINNTAEQRLRGTAIYMESPATLARNGSKWSYAFNLTLQAPGQPKVDAEETYSLVYEAAGQENVDTPAGKFKAVKLIRTVGANVGFDYFAKGVGLVKRESGEGTVQILQEYSGVKPVE